MTKEPTLTGRGVSPGVAEGTVYLLDDPLSEAEYPDDKQNILVSTYFTPVSLPFFVRAAGIVTDYGGQTSHGAVVAREMGIPCVTTTGDATSRLKHGSKVRIDGESGEIWVID